MPTVQDTFASDFAVGFPGMVANGETSNRITRSVEAAAGIAFGRAAFRGAADHGCVPTPGTELLGIVIADKGVPMLTAGQTKDAYPQYHSVPIMTGGVIWVLASGTFAPGDGVAVLNADGTFVPVGTAASTTLPGWKADTSAATGQMMRITTNRANAA